MPQLGGGQRFALLGRFLRGRRAAQSCSFCRDALDTERSSPCTACGTQLHDACWSELERGPSSGCPTLGCGGVRAPTLDLEPETHCGFCRRRAAHGLPPRIRSNALWTCPGCGEQGHPQCWGERCPSLGCDQLPAEVISGVPRPTLPETDCGFCRRRALNGLGDVVRSDELWTCPGCGEQGHPGCWGERCPSPGCDQLPPEVVSGGPSATLEAAPATDCDFCRRRVLNGVGGVLRSDEVWVCPGCDARGHPPCWGRRCPTLDCDQLPSELRAQRASSPDQARADAREGWTQLVVVALIVTSMAVWLVAEFAR